MNVRLNELLKIAIIVSTTKGYIVKSEKGKNLGGPYKTRSKAEKRLQQIEMFKNMDKKKKSIQSIVEQLKVIGEDDLADKLSCALSVIAGTKNPKMEYSYSFIMRKLRKGDYDRRLKFQKIFKEAFDEALNEKLDNPEQIALMSAIQAINFSE